MALRARVWTAGRLLLLGVALAATYGVFFLASMGVAIRARNVTVPQLNGKTIDDARALLAERGLDVVLDPVRRPDQKIPADHVLTQEPQAGTTLRRGRTVRLRISDGNRMNPLPDLTGLAENDATTRLSAMGFQLAGTAEIRTGDFYPDRIVAQDPPARSGSRSASLLINRGAQGVTYVMPDLIGTPEARVTELMRTRGFRITVVGYVNYPGLPGGVVVRQTPQAGFQIPPGETISLEVSR